MMRHRQLKTIMSYSVLIPLQRGAAHRVTVGIDDYCLLTFTMGKGGTHPVFTDRTNSPQVVLPALPIGNVIHSHFLLR